MTNYTQSSSVSYGSPFYHAASSLSLSCEVEGVENGEGLFYHWTSTSSASSFVRNSATRTISTPYLQSIDSGIHSCNVYDTAGCSGNVNITIKVTGHWYYLEFRMAIAKVYSCIAKSPGPYFIVRLIYA